MIKRNEAISILVAIVSISVALTLFKDINLFPKILLAVFLVILVNTLAKKVMSFYLESEIETNLWTIERYGFRPSQHFKKPFQAGIFFPLITSILFLGGLVWTASLTFDVKPRVYRAAKRHGLYSYSEMSENHIGLIAAAGVVANLFFAIIGYLIGFHEFSRINIYFAFFNVLPISDLDGNKIFFGNFIIWSFLAALALIALGYTFFLI